MQTIEKNLYVNSEHLNSDIILNEIRQELQIPIQTSNYNYNLHRNKRKTIDFSFYTFYFSFIIFTSWFFVSSGHKILTNGYYLSATMFIGISFIILLIIRIDLRMNSHQLLPDSYRKRSTIFTLVQYLMSLVLFVTVLSFNYYVLQRFVYFRFVDQPISIGLGGTILTVTYFYVYFLNRQPLKWYITGQPFWESTRNIINIPIASTRNLLAWIRLSIWLIALSIFKVPTYFEADFYLRNISRFILILLYIFICMNYTRKDIGLTRNLNLRIYTNTKAKESLNLNRINKSEEKIADVPINVSKPVITKSSNIRTIFTDPSSPKIPLNTNSREFLAKKSLFKIIDHVTKTRENEFQNYYSQFNRDQI